MTLFVASIRQSSVMLAKSQPNLTYYSCHLVHLGLRSEASSAQSDQMSVGSATDGILLKTRLL